MGYQVSKKIERALKAAKCIRAAEEVFAAYASKHNVPWSSQAAVWRGINAR